MNRVMNFSAGPSALPLSVLQRAREEMLDFAGTGMSVMEQSHRGKAYESLHLTTVRRLHQLMGLGDQHEVLLLQGGATQLFAQIPMNLLEKTESAGYIDLGTWGAKALAAGTAVSAHAELAAKADAMLPEAVRIDPRWKYVHMTSNETVHGVQWHGALTGVPFDAKNVNVVCDASSDIFSRPTKLSDYALVYAGAQKNLGPAGIVITAVRKDLIESGRKDIPSFFQFRTHAKEQSMHNTPPTFVVYMVSLVLDWIEEMGGLESMAKRTEQKSRAIYQAIDRSGGFYRGPVTLRARSEMNPVFRLPTEELEARFVKEAEANGMVGLKGHRSVGGIRVSLYNAVEPSSAEALADFMAHFVGGAG